MKRTDFNQKRRRARRDEEYATEFTADSSREIGHQKEIISTYGWIGLVLSIASFFMMPIIFGVAGIILGFVSRNKGAQLLGNSAIVVGVLSLIFRLIMIPF